MLEIVGCGYVRKDALDSRLRTSRMQDSHLDEEAVLQCGDVLAVATDL